MVRYNRTAAAKRLLAEIESWCTRTGTPETAIGHFLFLHPGFVGNLRKRLTVSEEKEAVVDGFLACHSDGWRGTLPKTHANGTRPVDRSQLARTYLQFTRVEIERMGLPPSQRAQAEGRDLERARRERDRIELLRYLTDQAQRDRRPGQTIADRVRELHLEIGA